MSDLAGFVRRRQRRGPAGTGAVLLFTAMMTYALANQVWFGPPSPDRHSRVAADWHGRFQPTADIATATSDGDGGYVFPLLAGKLVAGEYVRTRLKWQSSQWRSGGTFLLNLSPTAWRVLRKDGGDIG